MAGGRAGVADLRGPRLLNKGANLSAADLKAALKREAETLGFDLMLFIMRRFMELGLV
jgi:epoxyqueuosine reductase